MINCSDFMSIVNMDNVFWSSLIEIRDAINKCLQEHRDNKVIGSSLEAEVDIYADDRNIRLLMRGEEELRYFFIVSRADIHLMFKKPDNAKETSIEGLWITISKSQHPRCQRCWHHGPDVGLDKKYDGICYRCIDNIAGEGEKREFF